MNKKRVTLMFFVTISLLILPFISTASADSRGHGRRGPRWHVERGNFLYRNAPIWHAGYWHKGLHAGRMGWWWVVGSSWYWYPLPAYPYQSLYSKPVASSIQTAPSTQPAPQSPASVWYRCDNPSGYYPYVPECPSGWETVPAAPPSSTTPAAQVPPPSNQE